MINYSIIIPHYNTPNLLERLLLSIPNSEEVEIWVIDDNSTAELEQYNECKVRYASDRVHFLENEKSKKGAGACRNIGIENATGKWLLFADSDDLFCTDFIRILYIDADAEEDVIFYFPTCSKEDGSLGERHLPFCKLLKQYVDVPSVKNELTLRYQIVSPWSKLIRRSLVVDNNIRFENTKVANDMLFCRKLGVYARTIGVRDDCIYIVTDRDGSLVKKADAEALNIRREVYVNACRYVKSHVDAKTYRMIGYRGGQFTHLCREYHLGLGKYIETCFYFISKGIWPIG